MEINKFESELKRNSNWAAYLTLLGVLVVVATLLFSFYQLNQNVEKVQTLNQEIEDKEIKKDKLSEEIKVKEEKIINLQKTFELYQNNVKEKSESVAESAYEETIKENPASKQIIEEASKSEKAREKEIEGFKNLIKEEYAAAEKAFQEAEEIYPTFHNVYELAKLLRKNKDEMKSNSAKKKEVFQIIVREHSWKAPPDLLKKVEEIAEE